MTKDEIMKMKPYSDIAPVTIDGQEMIRIPKFYYKYTASPLTWEISASPAEGFQVHPAFMYKGVEKDCFYVGAYDFCNDNGKAGSKKGTMPWVNINFTQMQQYCSARGELWHLMNIHELDALKMLIFIQQGTPDVQTSIGQGNVSSSAAVAAGTSDAVWCGIYDLWGNVWQEIDGIHLNGQSLQMFDREGNGTYVDTGITIQSDTSTCNGYTNDFWQSTSSYDMSGNFIPKTSVSSQGDKPLNCDWIVVTSAYTSSNPILLHGGDWDNGTGAGLFYFYFWNYYVTDSSSDLGGRLARHAD